MASSLTIAQKIALYQVLEVPYATSYNTMDGMGTLTATTDVSGASSSAAYTSINTYLDTLTSNNGETQLIALLDRWIAIGTKVVSMDAGAVGGLQGVTMRYDQERALIEERIKYIVPYFRWHEVIAKKTEVGGMTIRINR